MLHMTHNYALGLIALVISFVVLFYVPIAYLCFQSHKQQRNQNK